MSIEALILGKLHQRPELRISGNSGREFVTAKVLTAAGDAGGVFVRVVAFGDTVCRALLAMDAGDALALVGTLKPGAWIDREGNARASVDLVASQVLTLYGLKKKRAAAADAAPAAATTAAPPPPSQQADDFGHDDTWLSGGQHGDS